MALSSLAYFSFSGMDQNDDPYARSVHCLVIGLLADLTPNKSWCSEDLEILVVSNLPDNQST